MQSRKKLIPVADRVKVVKKMWTDWKHKNTAMRANFTFNYCPQTLGRKMEAPQFQLQHMSLALEEEFAGVRDDCRVLALASYGTDKAARGEREKGVARHENFHLCAFAAAAYQLAWTNDTRFEVISHVRHALDPDRRKFIRDPATGLQRDTAIWGQQRLIFGRNPEETMCEHTPQNDWVKYPTSDEVSHMHVVTSHPTPPPASL